MSHGTEEVHRADDDMFLSPESRLLVDSPSGAACCVYDGNGHRLVLPFEHIAREPLPLILVRAGGPEPFEP